MSDTAIVPREPEALLDQARDLFLTVENAHTRRAYAARLDRFADWRAQRPDGEKFVAQLKAYAVHLRSEGMEPRSIQAHISTVKAWIRTAATIEPALSAVLPQLDLVKAPPVRGEAQGKRLSREQLQALLDAPDLNTHKGRRDRAVLGLLGLCGLRRSEVCNLTWEHITDLDGHKVIRNLSGKHGRVRTVKLPPSLWRRMVDYAEQAGLSTAPDVRIFTVIARWDKVKPSRYLAPNAIAHIVSTYAAAAGLGTLAPHDLRRTAASLSRKGGATIEQVQIMLGHASPQTTSHYIGEQLDLDDNAVDYIRGVSA